MHAEPSAVKAFGVKSLCANIAVIQFRAILQRIHKQI